MRNRSSKVDVGKPHSLPLSMSSSQHALDRADLREQWSRAAACLRCERCEAEQIELRDFTEKSADWRCRICKHTWKTRK